ncbi:L-aspartate oxidase [Streptomyces sp. AJS327]|uniref:L-aspartate oxidase n=1 Tax=Streptomyces sp. AJS327 TaxID=2545265 RepID=UPI0015E0348D|nr:L-aspartate oxidase [Streptomyces sp. AJS327]MBA0053082.1 L-aspartate oxidase [Streptomyces sp. AJS327]
MSRTPERSSEVPADTGELRLGGAEALAAPPPGWTLEADVVVVGSGVAGLTAALRCAAAGRRTVVVTKARLDDGSTRWAQGGIAAALGADDSPAQHRDDTLLAGAGLCDERAVHTLVTEGPEAVRQLIATGAAFDLAEDGGIELTREGGHRRRRIAHAGGDATGAEISRALVAAVTGRPADSRPVTGRPAESGSADAELPLRTVENALVLDLLTTPEGAAAGVTLHVMGEGQRDGVGAVRAPAVVLATGGMGQIFSATTNPAVSTGDGVALALRAGAEVSDLEFVQFHPTVLYLGRDARGQQPLISEAVRGEGAHLVDADGVRFMLGQHELAELAPRDVVAKAIMRRAAQQGVPHMYLDGRHFGAAMWESRFPTILASCRSHGVDPVTGLIPVAPAAHYASGGVRTDLAGRTTVPGLYACGEVSCTGVHGANRLASNSLLEGLVFAERIAARITAPGSGPSANPAPFPSAADGPAPGPVSSPARRVLLPPQARPVIQRVMTEGAGVLRSERSLAEAAARLDQLAAESDVLESDVLEAGTTGRAEPGVEAWETTNLLLVARALVALARRRAETRGCHWREDHPERDDRGWRHHLVAALPDASDHGPDQHGHRIATAARNLVVRTTETMDPTGTTVPSVANKEKP